MNNRDHPQRLEKVIYCENLYKTYSDVQIPIHVLNGVNLSIMSGEVVAIIGASGAGKSTLLQLLGGLDNPTSGKIYIVGEDITTLSEKEKGRLRNRALGFIYQFHHLLPEFSALENICLPLFIAGVRPREALYRGKVIIERVGLLDRSEHRVGELSGGERQRIAIARALVNEPRCVLADEPTGNLDEVTASQVFAMMLELNQELATSFVIVTHNISLARKCDRILKLDHGQLIEYTPEQRKII